MLEFEPGCLVTDVEVRLQLVNSAASHGGAQGPAVMARAIISAAEFQCACYEWRDEDETLGQQSARGPTLFRRLGSAPANRPSSLSRADDCGIYDETLARLPDAQNNLQPGPEIAEGGLLPEGESQTAARRPPDADVHCAQAPLLRNASTLYKRAGTAVARSHQVVNSIPHIPTCFRSAHDGG